MGLRGDAQCAVSFNVNGARQEIPTTSRKTGHFTHSWSSGRKTFNIQNQNDWFDNDIPCIEKLCQGKRGTSMIVDYCWPVTNYVLFKNSYKYKAEKNAINYRIRSKYC